MEMLNKINALLDQGYKMTNYSCQTCNAVTFNKPPATSVFCPKCNKQSEPADQASDKAEEQYDDFMSEYSRVTPNQTRSNQISKKIGTKLIQGWAMLEQSCQDCNVPYMKSRQGVKVCCGCGKEISDKKVQKKQAQKQMESKEDRPKTIRQEKPTSKTVKQLSGNTTECVERMQNKVLAFVEGRLDRAIQDNDLETVSKIIDLVAKTAKLNGNN